MVPFISSCHSSYLAEDTTRKCSDDLEWPTQCCKAAVGKNKNSPEDFYCFIDKGSHDGNLAFCTALADNPPYIHGLYGKRGPYEKEDPHREQKAEAKVYPKNHPSLRKGYPEDSSPIQISPILLFIGLVIIGGALMSAIRAMWSKIQIREELPY